MRSSTLRAAVLASLFAMGCSVDSLSGPKAQAAFTQARLHHGGLAEGVIMFVDGQRVSSESHVDLDPRTIQRIEIVKGPAAVQRYGDEARRGVVHIYTVSGSANGSTR
jgi:hypothetical protein